MPSEACPGSLLLLVSPPGDQGAQYMKLWKILSVYRRALETRSREPAVYWAGGT